MSFREKIEDIGFRLYRIIGRLLIKHSRNPRPSSAPYITGDGLRTIAHHIYDATVSKINPQEIKSGDIVFVGDSRIEEFLTKIHPEISDSYVLVTHNGDSKVTKELFEKAQDKIIRWYGINVEYDNERLTPIPLGIENKHYYVCGIPAVFNLVRKRKSHKLDKIFYAFTVSTNPTERGAALEVIKNHPHGQTLTTWRGFFPYLLRLNDYKFVLSPPGSCEEGHRTWDTMYIGGVPIVKSSITTRYFKKIGVPLYVIDDWNDLKKLAALTIPMVFEEVLSTSNPDTLTLEFWIKKIRNMES